MGDSSSLKPGTIVGFGNPLLDMTVVGDQNLLDKYDLKNNNAILAEEKHMPLYEELMKNENTEYTAGGSAQNSLRVAQWILEKPNVAVFFGAVGQDKYSEILKLKANNEGVDVKYQYSSKKPTGTCAVIVTNNGKDRSLCANLSAAETFTEDHLDVPENKIIIENAKFYLATGFFLQVNAKAVQKIAKVAFERKCPFLYNMSAPFIYQFYMDSVMSIFRFVNIVVGNDEEAKAFSEGQNWNLDNIEEIASKLSTFDIENGNRLVIITQGEKSVLVVKDGVITHYPVPKLPASDIIDSNGAGDAFIGGFISKYILGCPIKTCVEAGINAGSYIIQQPGISKGDSFKI
ncbi:adenosine kinase 1-like [Melanaphis sacchari]|uniref:adenosine kinase 1-like n=1 Tax=Melanaphis sacchari TaxID=742174 RepID=UPI000DC14675|nr:adenosine kinase 1-like [Melanaphis sacchari]